MSRFPANLPPALAGSGRTLAGLVGVGARAGVLALAVIEVLIRIMGSLPLVEMVSNLRVQLLVGALMTAVGLLADRSKLLPMALVLVSISSVELANFAFADGLPTPTGGEALTVMQYNVLASNVDFDAIATRINDEDADLVVLSEVTTRHLVEITHRLDVDYPHLLAEPWDDHATHLGGGLAILSRHPLSEINIASDATPTFRPMMAATISIENDDVLVVALHLPASRTDEAKVALRDRQLKTTQVLIESHAGPAVVVGDFNLAPTSVVYQDFIKRLKWQDPHQLVGWQPTWHFRDLPFGLPIDHVLVSPELELQRYEVGDGGGSDHKTLVAAIGVSP